MYKPQVFKENANIQRMTIRPSKQLYGEYQKLAFVKKRSMAALVEEAMEEKLERLKHLLTSDNDLV